MPERNGKILRGEQGNAVDIELEDEEDGTWIRTGMWRQWASILTRDQRPGGHNWDPVQRRALSDQTRLWKVWDDLNESSRCGNAADYSRPVVPQSLRRSLAIKAIAGCLGFYLKEGSGI